MPYDKPSNEALACMKDCAECASMCAQTAHHCLAMGGDHASPDHQGLLQDCKQLCSTAVNFMARSSHHAADLCRLCATVCNECADDCDRLANGDQMMSQCAQTCRKCAETCEKMAGAAV